VAAREGAARRSRARRRVSETGLAGAEEGDDDDDEEDGGAGGDAEDADALDIDDDADAAGNAAGGRPERPAGQRRRRRRRRRRRSGRSGRSARDAGGESDAAATPRDSSGILDSRCVGPEGPLPGHPSLGAVGLAVAGSADQDYSDLAAGGLRFGHLFGRAGRAAELADGAAGQAALPWPHGPVGPYTGSLALLDPDSVAPTVTLPAEPDGGPSRLLVPVRNPTSSPLLVALLPPGACGTPPAPVAWEHDDAAPPAVAAPPRPGGSPARLAPSAFASSAAHFASFLHASLPFPDDAPAPADVGCAGADRPRCAAALAACILSGRAVAECAETAAPPSLLARLASLVGLGAALPQAGPGGVGAGGGAAAEYARLLAEEPLCGGGVGVSLGAVAAWRQPQRSNASSLAAGRSFALAEPGAPGAGPAPALWLRLGAGESGVLGPILFHGPGSAGGDGSAGGAVETHVWVGAAAEGRAAEGVAAEALRVVAGGAAAGPGARWSGPGMASSAAPWGADAAVLLRETSAAGVPSASSFGWGVLHVPDDVAARPLAPFGIAPAAPAPAPGCRMRTEWRSEGLARPDVGAVAGGNGTSVGPWRPAGLTSSAELAGAMRVRVATSGAGCAALLCRAPGLEVGSLAVSGRVLRLVARLGGDSNACAPPAEAAVSPAEPTPAPPRDAADPPAGAESAGDAHAGAAPPAPPPAAEADGRRDMSVEAELRRLRSEVESSQRWAMVSTAAALVVGAAGVAVWASQQRRGNTAGEGAAAAGVAGAVDVVPAGGPKEPVRREPVRDDPVPEAPAREEPIRKEPSQEEPAVPAKPESADARPAGKARRAAAGSTTGRADQAEPSTEAELSRKPGPASRRVAVPAPAQPARDEAPRRGLDDVAGPPTGPLTADADGEPLTPDVDAGGVHAPALPAEDPDDVAPVLSGSDGLWAELPLAEPRPDPAGPSGSDEGWAAESAGGGGFASWPEEGDSAVSGLSSGLGLGAAEAGGHAPAGGGVGPAGRWEGAEEANEEEEEEEEEEGASDFLGLSGFGLSGRSALQPGGLGVGSAWTMDAVLGSDGGFGLRHSIGDDGGSPGDGARGGASLGGMALGGGGGEDEDEANHGSSGLRLSLTGVGEPGGLSPGGGWATPALGLGAVADGFAPSAPSTAGLGSPVALPELLVGPLPSPSSRPPSPLPPLEGGPEPEGRFGATQRR